jgi:hypothetical protein
VGKSALSKLYQINLDVITPLQASVVFLSHKHLYDAHKAAEELAALEDTNARLINAAVGRGMVSEMDNMQEVAVLVCGLHDEIAQIKADRENAYKEIRDMNRPMPCGHLARYAVNEEDGTQYCVMCVLEATQLTIINLVNEDEQ